MSAEPDPPTDQGTQSDRGIPSGLDPPDGEQSDGEQSDEQTGADAVRAALGRAKAAAQARGLRPGRPGQRDGGVSAAARARQRRDDAQRRSGAAPDARDPQAVAASISRLVAERGWSEPVAVGGVLGRWDTVVGPDVAAHCTPASFADGVLVVEADSSAWATQVKLLVPAMLRRLAEEVGEGTVTKVVVRGPTAPSWRKGPRVAPGSRGPRDTYG